MKIYVNGKEVGVKAGGDHNTEIPTMNRTFSYLGRSAWAHDGYFAGTLDEFAIFDRLLTPEERLCLADICDGSCHTTCEEKAD